MSWPFTRAATSALVAGVAIEVAGTIEDAGRGEPAGRGKVAVGTVRGPIGVGFDPHADTINVKKIKHTQRIKWDGETNRVNKMPPR